MDGNENAAVDSASTRGASNTSRHRHSTRRVVDAESQRARLLAYMVERGSVSTLEARGRHLRIMSPAARIFELKAEGVPILSTHDAQQGCARYWLLNGGDHGR